jgi:hypothetical protein
MMQFIAQPAKMFITSPGTPSSFHLAFTSPASLTFVPRLPCSLSQDLPSVSHGEAVPTSRRNSSRGKADSMVGVAHDHLHPPPLWGMSYASSRMLLATAWRTATFLHCSASSAFAYCCRSRSGTTLFHVASIPSMHVLGLCAYCAHHSAYLLEFSRASLKQSGSSILLERCRWVSSKLLRARPLLARCSGRSRGVG